MKLLAMAIVTNVVLIATAMLLIDQVNPDRQYITQTLVTPVNQLELTRQYQRQFTDMVNHGVNTIKEQPA